MNKIEDLNHNIFESGWCLNFMNQFNQLIQIYGVVRVLDLYDKECFYPVVLEGEPKAAYYNYGWTEKITQEHFEYVSGVKDLRPFYKLKLPKIMPID